MSLANHYSVIIVSDVRVVAKLTKRCPETVLNANRLTITPQPGDNGATPISIIFGMFIMTCKANYDVVKRLYKVVKS